MHLVTSSVFPTIIGGIPGPLLQLLTAGWRTALAVPEQWWNLGLTVLGGLLLYFVLSADVSRLGLSAVLGTRTMLRVPLYAVCAGLATQLPRFVLEIIYGWRQEFPAGLVIQRIASGFLTGGIRIAVMVALALLALAYLSAVRIAALGEAQAGRALWLERVLGGMILIGCFAIVSLTSIGFIFDVLKLIAVLVLFHVLIVLAISRCGVCGRRPWGALRISTRCGCGHERLPYLRSFVKGARQPRSLDVAA